LNSQISGPVKGNEGVLQEQRMAKPEMRVLFITSVRCEGPVNQNHYQRIAMLSERTQLTILAQRRGFFPVAQGKGAEVVTAWIPGRLGVLVKSLMLAMSVMGRRFDLVITDPSVLGLCGAIMKLLARRKWVVDVWDIPIRVMNPEGVIRVRAAILRRLMRLAYRQADHFIVSILPDQELTWFRIPARKISAFTNAIWRDGKTRELSVSTTVEKGNDILCMRSCHGTDMGLDTLAQAFTILESEFPKLTLTIIGTIPPDVKRQVESILRHPRVRALDFVRHEEVMQRIASATVCVVPFKDVSDLAQTYPIKVLEFLSMGKPVVASNIGGLARMIRDRQNGLLFQAGNPVDLAERVAELIRNSRLRDEISQEAMRLGLEHDAHEKGRQILALLKQLAAN
jgi:glycosyltransferase involved in cell wall biosynthesis